MFSFEFYSFGCYHYIFHAFWVSIYIWCEVRVQFHSFACAYPVKYHGQKSLVGYSPWGHKNRWTWWLNNSNNNNHHHNKPSYSRTICWKDYSFLTEWSWQHCQKSVDHRCWGFISGVLIVFHLEWNKGMSVLNTSTMLFWLLLLCTKFWNWKVWVFQFCSSFSRLFWLFWVPWASIWMLGSTYIFYKAVSWYSNRD